MIKKTASLIALCFAMGIMFAWWIGASNFSKIGTNVGGNLVIATDPNKTDLGANDFVPELPTTWVEAVDGEFTLTSTRWLAMEKPAGHCITYTPMEGVQPNEVVGAYFLRSYNLKRIVQVVILKRGETLADFTCN
ncbi:MAG: hypothetical protein RLZZ76_184 [Candidatus Parcubacteria bacterium]|jgi:hypothetical protein